MFARSLSQWAFAIFVTVGASAVVAQERAITITKTPAQTLYMRPGFQQNIALQGNARIGTIHVGDDTVASVATVSDRQFVITALPAKNPTSIGRTNILVRDTDQNVIANLEMRVSPYDEDTHDVETHKLIGTGREEKIGVTLYQCSPVRCYKVTEEKIELPTVNIRRENNETTTNTNTTTTTNTTPAPKQ